MRCSIVAQSKEVGHLNVAPVKLRQNRLKALSTSEPAASQGILTVVSRTVLQLVCNVQVSSVLSVSQPSKEELVLV